MSTNNKFLDFAKQNKVIVISVDAGYDAHKIIINNEFHKRILSLCLNSMSNLHGLSNDLPFNKDTYYALYNNKKYVMGNGSHELTIETLNAENNQILTNNFTEKRFSSEAFKVSLLTAIGVALREYSQNNTVDFKWEDLDQWKIELVVEVPFDYSKECTPILMNILTANNQLEIYTKDGIFNFNLKLEREQIRVVSQVLSAYRSLWYDTFGNEVSDEEYIRIEQNLDSLLVDAGYYTLGILQINKELEAMYGKENIAKKNIAMFDIDKAVADRINSLYRGSLVDHDMLEPIHIQSYTSKDGSEPEQLLLYKEGNSFKAIDVNEIKTEEIKKAQEELVQYIKDKFFLNKLKSIYVYGGTGKVFFEHIKEACSNDLPWLKDISIINGYCNGENLGPVYAVAYGGMIERIFELLNPQTEE